MLAWLPTECIYPMTTSADVLSLLKIVLCSSDSCLSVTAAVRRPMRPRN